MGQKTKVRKFGNSLGIILPKEAISALKVQEGAAVYLSEGPGCSLRLAAGKPDFLKQMAVGEDLMQRYRNALQELAK
jgi:putative addiction module antidote